MQSIDGNTIYKFDDDDIELSDQLDFSGKDLSGMDFSDCVLRNADFSGCDLSGANFNSCIMNYCNFSGATLSGAIFIGADLSFSNIFDADTSTCDMTNAVLP